VADLWLKGYEKIDLNDGLSYTGGPAKFVLHTMEGTIESAIAAFTADPGKASHAAISFEKQRHVQFIPYNYSAKSLRHLSGQPETNREHAYQVEIEGYAAQSPSWSDDHLRFVAQHIADVSKIVDPGFPVVSTVDWSDPSPRLTADQYTAYNGILGHRHVPENDHTDPGALDITKLLQFTNEALGAQPPPTSEDDMARTGMVLRADGVQFQAIIRKNGKLECRWTDAAHPIITANGWADMNGLGVPPVPFAFDTVTPFVFDNRFHVEFRNFDSGQAVVAAQETPGAPMAWIKALFPA
jgi:hypothetical protein